MTDYSTLPEYDSGWDAHDWEAVFDGKYNNSPPEWRTVGVPGEAVEPLRPQDFAEIEAVWTECNVDYADSSIVALIRLVDGRYATLVAWSDSSGWGCQDATYWKIAPNREDAIKYGLDNDGRRLLGFEL